MKEKKSDNKKSLVHFVNCSWVLEVVTKDDLNSKVLQNVTRFCTFDICQILQGNRSNFELKFSHVIANIYNH